jgi:glycosyltransferase involved in cell wall biosynthesis
MNKLKVLSINKYYRLEGGADREMFNIEKILIDNGHEVIPFSTTHKKNKPNDWNEYFTDGLDINRLGTEGLIGKLKKFSRIIYNYQAKKKLSQLLDVVTPDIAHIHNLHYEMSPSVIHILNRKKIPIVMHLHDMRLFCPNGVFFTQGEFCQACMYNKFYNVLAKKCLQDSYKASFAAMLANYLHYYLRIWKKHVDRYIIPTKILTDMSIDYGIAKEKIDTYDYFIDLEKYAASDIYDPYFVFYGFQGVSKGIMILLRALRKLHLEGFEDYKLKIYGAEGPVTNDIKNFISDNFLSNHIEYLGFVNDSVLFKALSNSLFVVLPSIGSENSNCVIRESNALGKMVLGSRIGGIPEQIKDKETGFLFAPGDINDLSSKIKYLFENPQVAIKCGKNSIAHVGERSDKQYFYTQLLQTYTKSIESYNK